MDLQRTPEAIDFWLPVVVLFGFLTLFYVFCQLKKDNSYIDVVWGITFLLPVLALIFLKLGKGEKVYARVILNVVLIGIWAVRLALHIGLRHKGEDFRYVEMRADWMKKGGWPACYFFAFNNVFMF